MSLNKTQQVVSVTAICLSILLSGLFVAYKPGVPVDSGLNSSPLSTTGVSASGVKAIAEGTTDTAKTLSVSGTGTISAKADEATIVLGVFTEEKTAAAAIDGNAQIMDAVIEAVKALGFTNDDMQTTSYSVYPNYSWDAKQVISYQVTNMVQVKVKDLSKVGTVIDAAAAAGANRMDGVSFGLSDAVISAMKIQAYEAAIADVKTRVSVITENLGIAVSSVQSVSESYSSPPVPYRSASYDMAAGVKASTPIISGSLSVSVSINVVYIIA
jgi:hypothetical protein